MISGWIDNLCSKITGMFAGASPRNRGGVCVSAPCHAAGVRPASGSAPLSARWLRTALLLVCLAPLPAIGANNGDLIVTKAQLTSSNHATVYASITVTYIARTPSTTEFLKYAPGVAGAVSSSVGPTWYTSSSGAFTNVNPPLTVGTGVPIDLSAPVPLMRTTVFHAGEPIFIRVTDLDQNLNSSVAETIIVIITDPKTGDSETLRLTESGVNTGIFIGYLHTASAFGGANNGILSVSEASSIQAKYTDTVDGTDSSADAALVDPFGIVFDTRTGRPVDGATVELLNADGSSAAVFGDNGLVTNSYPNTVVSGSTATDSELNTYSFPPGGYRFPFVNPGSYILKISPPPGYIAPSVVSTTIIQTLPGAPFAILEPGSRGEVFAVPSGPAIRVDIPLDPKTGSLWLKKSAGKSIVSAGEYLGYELILENKDTEGSVYSPVLVDKLPHGFRYQKGSVKVNGATAPDPDISPDGATMTFNLTDIPPATSVSIRYTVAVGAGAQTGVATNTAAASAAQSVRSNSAKATVQVQEPFMKSRNIIMGRVFVGACSDNPDDSKKGMEGVGIYLEDGTFVFSDKMGMFHFEGVRSGSHVVQLDLDSLPEGYKILHCEQNSRFAGRAYSQFVDMQGGTMWRTDFYLGRTELSPLPAEASTEKPVSIGKGTEAESALATTTGMKSSGPAAATANYKGEVTLEMISSQSGNFIDYRIPLQSAAVPLTNLILTVSLPQGATYVNGSSNFNDTAITDPIVTADKISYHLGSTSAEWQRELRFRVAIGGNAQVGELKTTAVLTFDSPEARGVAAPAVDNLLSLMKEESRFELPAIVLRPQFPTFGAELSEPDRKQLDELAQMLGRFKINSIDVAGHTDNVRIAPRSRNIYADNTALSFARARSVGRYLMAALHLPPEKLNLTGSGEKSPVATNRTVAGRALNRRVEVKVSAERTVETAHLKIIKERSGIRKQETAGGPVKLPTEGLAPLVPLQLNGDKIEMQSASNQAGVVGSLAEPAIAQGIIDPPSNAQVAGQSQKSQPMKAEPAAAKGDELQADLLAALEEGIVHYRISLKHVTEPIKGLKATLVLPVNQLYMTGTSRLGDKSAPDPTASDTGLIYNYDKLPDDRKFTLRLKTLLDLEDKSDANTSSLTLVITDAAGNPLKTLTATTELSDDIKGIYKPDDQPAVELNKSAAYVDETELYREKVTSAKKSAAVENDPYKDLNLHVADKEGILSPADGNTLATRISAVRIVLNSLLTPVLMLDGVEIPSDRIGFSLKDSKTDKTLYTYIGVDFGEEGSHSLQLKGIDSFSVARVDQTVKIHRSGEITSIRLVSADGNIADGRTPVRVKIQMFDKDDKLVNTNAELTMRGGNLHPLGVPGGLPSGGPVVFVDGDGWVNFHPVNNSGLYHTQLTYNKATLDVETNVKPKMRDWILVGLAEGTVGYNTLSGHMENLQATAQEEHLYDKERLALYAKGTIKGEWLLTMAYDSAKQRTGVSGNALFQTIDPNSFYTLYGDGSSQLYDAPSQRKLYLKIERDQFYALFGDFDSGLTVTEFSRYSRRMNGLKSELQTKHLDLSAFGSQTEQSYVRDEIRGDGTSGLYRLSRTGIVLNSEKITIESRDRFRSELVTDSRQLSRFVDYSIDYDTGAIFFKSPVASKDDQLNPVYIVIEYEIANAGNEALTYGGRAATKLLDGKLKIGGTYVHEGHVSGDSNLYGGDMTAELGAGTKFRAEAATTDNDGNLGKTSGNAYLAEIVHAGKTVDGKAYFRQQESGFGLGQQLQSETGTRKFGAEGGYRLNDKVALNSQAYRQYTLSTGAFRDFMELLASYSEKEYSLRSGVKYANDTLTDGTSASSVLGTAGASWKTLNQKLTLRIDHDQALFQKNDNADFPTRTIIGADYQATKDVAIFAQEELTYGAIEESNSTRVGIKSTPWKGGAISSSVVNDMRENSERTFANIGLTQKWQLNRNWAVDGGLDQNRTVRKKTGYQLNSNVPPASGGEDFTAVSLGANYAENKLLWTNRVEYRTSSTDDKWGVISGLANEKGLNWGWTARLQVLHTESDGGSSSTNGDVRLGLVYRPPVTNLIVLDRLDLIATDQKSPSSSTHGNRFINNMNANYRPDKKTQLSLQYGAKYVLEQIDELDYSGFTDLVGVEGRYDITKTWDIGVRCSLLHTWAVKQFDYSYGPSVGYNVMENTWISLGYNFAGFKDRDFSAANYTAEGPYIQFRFKFDQNSVKEGLKVLGQ